jgi:TonB family protein
MSDRERDPALRPKDRGRVDRRRIAGGLGVSLLLHAAVILAFLLVASREPEHEDLPAPSTVSMVFNGGRPEGPTSPVESAEPRTGSAVPSEAGAPPGGARLPMPPPPAPEVPPPPELKPPPPEPAPPQPEPTPPALLPVPPLPPEPVPPPPVPPPPPPEPVPVPPMPVPAPPEPASPPPEPTEKPAMPSPPPQPVPPNPGPPEQAVTPPSAAPREAQMPAVPKREAPPPPPPTPPRPLPPQVVPPPRAPAFPAPMNFSFGPPAAEPGATAPGKHTLSLSLPPVGPENASPFSLDTDAEVGPDWRNLLVEWVGEHSYYPHQAAALGQDGFVRVVVTTEPNGHVVSVELERKSGSQWLDMALEGMFRGAQLPPLPKQAGDQPITFHFTMHYILVR